MPSTLAIPVLALALDSIHNINKLDSDDLGSMWTVFTKCKESLEHGRRLENISWRLWYRETMLHKQHPVIEASAPLSVPANVPDYQHDQARHTVPLPPAVEKKVITPLPESATTKQLSPFSFRKIITSLIPAGADATNWGALKEAATQKEASSAPTVPTIVIPAATPATETSNVTATAAAATTATATTAATSSLPDMRSISSTNLSKNDTPAPSPSVTGGGQATFRSRNVVKGFTRQRNRNISTIARDMPRKFFVDSEEDDAEEEDDDDDDDDDHGRGHVTTSGTNNFALRLKKDSLPRHHRFSKSLASRLQGSISSDETDCDSTEEEKEGKNTEQDLDAWDVTYSYDLVNFSKKTPPPTRCTSLLSSLLAAPTNSTSTQSSTCLRSSRCVYKDLYAISDASHEQVKPQPIPTAPHYVAPIRSPATIRRDILVTELSESLRRNLLWERQQRMLGQPHIQKSREAAVAVASKARVAEPVLEKVMVESFRGW